MENKTPMIAIPWDGARDEFSLRDWFAGQALAGILAHHGTQCFGWTKSGYQDASAHHEAYKHADAMLAAREAKK